MPTAVRAQYARSKTTAQAGAAAQPTGVRSSWYRGWLFQSMPFKSMVGLSAVFVLLSVPVLAERAVPGDMLYSVKIGFNEEVRSSISRSPYEEIEWETERLNRRLVEAQVLAREGRLTEEQETQVAEAVRSHSEAARESIERLRENDADEAAMAEITLSALFDVHTAVLSAHASGTDDIGQRQSRIAAAIAESRGDADGADDATKRPSYEGLLARIEVESNRAYNMFAAITETASEEELASMSRRLEDVDRKVQQGVTAYEAGDEMDARTLLTEALTTTRKVITFMSNLEVRNSVALDTLVPVEYTTAELTELLEEKHRVLHTRYEHLNTLVTDADTDEIASTTRTEILEQFEAVPEQFATATSAIAAEEFDTARTTLQAVQDLLDDTVSALDLVDFGLSDTASSSATTTGTSSEVRADRASTTATSSDSDTSAGDTAATSSEAEQGAAATSSDAE